MAGVGWSICKASTTGFPLEKGHFPSKLEQKRESNPIVLVFKVIPMKSLLLQTLCISVKQYLASVLSPGMHIYKMGCLLDFHKRPKVLHESKHKLTLLAS